jgi:hypothetical protein
MGLHFAGTDQFRVYFDRDSSSLVFCFTCKETWRMEPMEVTKHVVHKPIRILVWRNKNSL